MLKTLLLAATMTSFAAGPVMAETIKVGILGPLSGPFTLFGKNFKIGIDAWVQANGKTVDGNTVEFVYRDLPEPNPAQAKALAQELIVKDKVQYIGGVVFTPNALAIAPLLEESKVVFVTFNAATSIITQKSPNIVRTSFTLAQVSGPMGKIAADRGVKQVVTAVTDYGPGVDSEAAFKKSFEAAGGKVVESIRMPIKTTDYAPFMQRVKDSGADAVFAFLPAGPNTQSFAKAFIDSGLKEKGVKFLTTGDLTQEPDLPALGDAAIGILSTFAYSKSHDSDANRAFLAKAKEAGANMDDLTFPAVAAYDGAFVIYKMIAATGGKQDPAKALAVIQDLAWESPRGPVKFNGTQRHVTQTVYLRSVEKSGAGYINKEIGSLPAQPDLGLPPTN